MRCGITSYVEFCPWLHPGKPLAVFALSIWGESSVVRSDMNVRGEMPLHRPQNPEEVGMSKKSKADLKVSRKTYWHLYSLQNLNSEKLVKVVNKILRNEYHLIK